MRYHVLRIHTGSETSIDDIRNDGESFESYSHRQAAQSWIDKHGVDCDGDRCFELAIVDESDRHALFTATPTVKFELVMSRYQGLV